MSDSIDPIPGFRLICAKGEVIEVSSKQATVVALNCDYFQNVFRHGTVETKDRVLRKPDWSRSTALSLLQILSEGEAKVRDTTTLTALADAANQTLVEIYVAPPKAQEGEGVRIDEVPAFSPQSSWIFEGECELTSESWLKLLRENGTLIGEGKEGGLMVRSNGISKEIPEKKNRSGNPVDKFLIFFESCLKKETRHFMQVSGATHTSESILATCASLRNTEKKNVFGEVILSNKKQFLKEEFSLRIPLSFLSPAPDDLLEALKSKVGVHGYVHKPKSTMGYYLGTSVRRIGCPTLFGSFRQLCDALLLIPEAVIDKCCSLRICAPSPDTLSKILTALGLCKDHPGSLGVDIEANAFYAVKTTNDMKKVLSALSLSNNVRAPSDHPCKIFDLSCGPSGVF